MEKSFRMDPPDTQHWCTLSSDNYLVISHSFSLCVYIGVCLSLSHLLFPLGQQEKQLCFISFYRYSFKIAVVRNTNTNAWLNALWLSPDSATLPWQDSRRTLMLTKKVCWVDSKNTKWARGHSLFAAQNKCIHILCLILSSFHFRDPLSFVYAKYNVPHSW